MDQFDAARFIAQLEAGAFDGCLTQEIRKLTKEQLEQVAEILADRDSAVTSSVEA